MTRWIGLLLMALALPLFWMIRDGLLKIRMARLRARVGAALFGIGLLGLCLFVFGGMREALAFMALWGFLAWAYNL
ncbi:MAG: hypothetical protein KY468_02865 [Armatimonadetes bacterium]|nr:hypothetical protein [Armatimonadota bacterium]